MNELLSPSARTWAEIDMAALKHNYEIARATGKKVMCVIKADAYGHGAVRCGRYLEKCGADAFAVACLSEALELRQGGITKTILILGYTSHEYAKVLADNDITQTLVDESHALELNEAAKAANVTVKGHIKLDTGMSRAGLFAQGHDAAMKAAEAAERRSFGARLAQAKAKRAKSAGKTRWQACLPLPSDGTMSGKITQGLCDLLKSNPFGFPGGFFIYMV